MSGYEPCRLLFSSVSHTDQLRITVEGGFEGQNILFYLPEHEGWFPVREDLKDSTFAAAILNVIFDDKELYWTIAGMEDTDAVISDQASSTKTAEIDN